MSTPSDSALERLRMAAVDGRTENIRFRQNELQALHAVLRNNAEPICSAISQEKKPSTEAEIEYSLAMAAVKHFYETLDFDKALQDEYLVANGADNANRKVGRGVVFIRPTRHTRFYSIVCPLVAAIVAGNCVLLELQDPLSTLDELLKKLISSALDQDTCAIVSNCDQSKADNGVDLWVDQTATSPISTSAELLSNISSRSIAIVDRTADMEAAAEAIVTARMAFNGTSPYSPDLVIVNDFSKPQFLAACTKHAERFIKETGSRSQATGNPTRDAGKEFKDAESKGQLSIVSSADLVFGDVSNRSSSVLDLKISGLYLPIVACTSMVDALGLVSETPLLASYLFGEPAACKFLSQHLRSPLSIANQIPTHLLLGPAAPISHPPAIQFRYTTAMFSSASPQYINFASEKLLPIPSLGSSTGTAGVAKLRSEAVQPLKPTGQKKGFAIGFFEQGILLGLGVMLTVVVPTVSIAVFVLGKKAWYLAGKLPSQDV